MISRLKNRLAEWTVGARIITGALLLAAVAAVWLVYFINHHERNQVLHELQGRLMKHANFKASELQRYLGTIRRDVLFLSRTPPVQGIRRAAANRGYDDLGASSLEHWKRRLQAVFESFMQTHPGYFQIRYIGVADNGRELVRVNRQNGQVTVVPADRAQQKGDRYYVKNALMLNAGEVYLSAIDLNREHGKVQRPVVRTLRAATPVLAPDGQRFGIVVINLDVGPALDRLAVAMRDGVMTYLMNDQGDFLVHPNADWTFGFDLGQRFRWGDYFSTKDTAASNDRFQSGFSRVATDDGPQYVAMKRIYFDPQSPERFLTLAYTLPEAAINQRVAEARNVIIAGALGALLVVSALFFLYVKRISRPLMQLTDAADKISKRQYDTPLPEVNGGGIEVFVRAFNRMQHEVRQREERILQLNEQLKREEKLANQVIDTAPDAIIVVDAHGYIVRANHRMNDLFGYEHEEMIGQQVELLIPERFREQHKILREDYIRHPELRMMGFGRELHARHKSGNDFWVEIGLGTMLLENERYAIAAITDISKRKQAEEALQDSLERLARSNEELEQFAYVASHDLQEPLRSIAGPLQLLQKRYANQLDETADKFLDHAVSGATRMQQLIDDLLTYSRAARRTETFKPVDCNVLLGQVKQALSMAMKESNATIHYDNLPTVHGDRSQLFQLFQNLIANAIKFRGDRNPVITVSATFTEGNRWRISVKDNGIGIEPQHQERVFRIFQRLHTRREYSGTGIGLALCKRIVERHGGRIWMESGAGEGAIFYFILAAGNTANPSVTEDQYELRKQVN